MATPLLVHIRLGTTEPATNEDDDVSAEIQAWYDDYQNKLRAERAEERKEEGRRFLLQLLQARFGELPPDAVARVEDAELGEIERWGLRVLTAQSLAEVLDQPS